MCAALFRPYGAITSTHLNPGLAPGATLLRLYGGLSCCLFRNLGLKPQALFYRPSAANLNYDQHPYFLFPTSSGSSSITGGGIYPLTSPSFSRTSLFNFLNISGSPANVAIACSRPWPMRASP